MGILSILSGIKLSDVYTTLSSRPQTKSQIASQIVNVNDIGEIRAAIFDSLAVEVHLETLIERGHANKVFVSPKHHQRRAQYGYHLTRQGEAAISEYQ